MTKNQEAVAAQATVVHAGWDGPFERVTDRDVARWWDDHTVRDYASVTKRGGLMGQFASCFPRRETRVTCRNMVLGLLMVK